MAKRRWMAAAVLLCLLAGCAGPRFQRQPIPTHHAEATPAEEVTVTPTPKVTPDPTPTATPVPLTWDPSIPVRHKELFSAGIDTWGTQRFTAYYEDEYGPYFDIDVTLPWTTAEGEGYNVINKRFEELMEEYKKEVWPAYPPEDRPPFAPPGILIDIHPYPTPAEVGRLVSFRFLENDYYGGVHGLCRAWVETYDVTTGERLAFNDFFSDPEEAEARIQAEIQRQVEADRETYGWLFYEGHINPGVISPFDRELVYPVEDGFEVFYQWYSIGGHAFGAPTFLIPWEVLEGVTDSSVFGTAPESEPWGQQTVIVNKYQHGQQLVEYSCVQPFARRAGTAYDAINAYYPNVDALLTEAEEYFLLASEYPNLPGLPLYSVSYSGLSFETDELIQISSYYEAYLGGAHPSHSSSSDCFDLKTGALLELPDLFSDWDTAKAVIWDTIYPQILDRFPEDQVERSAESAREDLEENPVFFIDPEGLTIHYNEYVIASYADGPSDFFVPKEKLSNLTTYPIWD